MNWAGRSSISKPYLSLIETGRVPNPPSDEKLSRLEKILGFKPAELVSQAHLERTPGDVRAAVGRLMRKNEDASSEDAFLIGLLQEMMNRSAEEPIGAEPIGAGANRGVSR